MVSAATYIVNGVQVTAGVDEELHQDGEVVPHGDVRRRGALLGGWRGTDQLMGPSQDCPGAGWC